MMSTSEPSDNFLVRLSSKDWTAETILRLFGDLETIAKISKPGIDIPIEIKELPRREIEFDFGPPIENDPYETTRKATQEIPESIGLTDAVQQDTVIEISFKAESRIEVLAQIAELIKAKKDDPDFPQNDISIDVPLGGLQGFLGHGEGLHWDVINGGKFGVRRNAHHLLDQTVPNLPDDCDDIGVVIVDEGLSTDYVRALGGRFGGGWQLLTPGAPAVVGRYNDPHERAADGHGNMVARNVLEQAPSAVIYDAPVLPSRVTNVEMFSSDAKLLLDAIAFVLGHPDHHEHFPKHKHWIIVNAWGVATSFADTALPFRYANSRKHRLNRSVINLANMDETDVVFAAGNSGAFDPARFAGPYDRGHHHSIWGANGLPEVFTIGAVRTDGIGIGASSQGPSHPDLTADNSINRKPDFSAPSWFMEDLDQTIANTGTSAACAVFAGWLAKLRTVYPDPASQELKDALGEAEEATWSHQTGHTMRDPAPHL